MAGRGRAIKIIISVVIIVLLLIIAFHWFMSYMIQQKVLHHVTPPTAVSTATAKGETWQPRIESVGQLTAINGVTVTTEASGIVMKLGFKSGQMVEQGQFLIQLDDSLDVQDLKNNQAQLNVAQLDFNRKAKLYRTAAVAKSDYDNALATLRKAEAQVSKVLVEISQKRIRAPFSGKVGIRQVNIGQYLNPGDAIVTLQSLNPLFVDFSIAQRDIKNVKHGQKISISIDAFPGQTFEGKVTAINALVTQNTRNIDIQATIPNDNNMLYPGLFGNVSLYLPQEKQVVTLPQTAVSYSLFGDICYVLKPSGKTSKDGKKLYTLDQRVVKTGRMIGNKIQILSGVSAGDLVVSSGQLKLEKDMVVYINNSVTMTLPTPTELEGGEKTSNE